MKKNGYKNRDVVPAKKKHLSTFNNLHQLIWLIIIVLVLILLLNISVELLNFNGTVTESPTVLSTSKMQPPNYYYSEELTCKVYKSIDETIDQQNPDIVYGYDGKKYVVVCYLDIEKNRLCTIYSLADYEKLCKALIGLHGGVKVGALKQYVHLVIGLESINGKVLLRDGPKYKKKK